MTAALELELAASPKLDPAPSAACNGLAVGRQHGLLAYAHQTDVYVQRAVGAARLSQRDGIQGTVHSVSVGSARGRDVVLVCNQYGVALYDLAGDALLQRIPTPADGDEPRSAGIVERHGGEGRVVVGSTSGKVAVHVFEADSFTIHAESERAAAPQPLRASVSCVVARPSEVPSGVADFAACDLDGHVATFAANGAHVASTSFPGDGATSVCFVGGSLLAVAHASGTIRFCAADSLVLVAAVGAHSRAISALATSPPAAAGSSSMNVVASAGEDGLLCVWAAEPEDIRLIGYQRHPNAILCGCAFPTTNRVATIAYEGTVAWQYNVAPPAH